MISPSAASEDFRVLGRQWHANHVRWQLLWGGFPHGPADRAGLVAHRQQLAEALQGRLQPGVVGVGAGLLVLIDRHTPPAAVTPPPNSA